MNSLQIYLDNLTPSQMDFLQQKLGFSKESNTDTIMKTLYENENYKNFCEQERKEDARNVYLNIIMVKSKNQIRTIQNDFSKNIQQKETQFPILFLKYCINSQQFKSSSTESVPQPLQTIPNCKEKVQKIDTQIKISEIKVKKSEGKVQKSERNIKRFRTSFRHHPMFHVMKDLFQRNQNPESLELKKLASEMGLKPQLMMVCFYF